MILNLAILQCASVYLVTESLSYENTSKEENRQTGTKVLKTPKETAILIMI